MIAGGDIYGYTDEEGVLVIGATRGALERFPVLAETYPFSIGVVLDPDEEYNKIIEC